MRLICALLPGPNVFLAHLHVRYGRAVRDIPLPVNRLTRFKQREMSVEGSISAFYRDTDT